MTPQQIENRLKGFYTDGEVLVQDLTGTQDHYEVRVISAKFNELSRIQAHRQVMGLFDVELKSGEVHALTIKIIKAQ